VTFRVIPEALPVLFVMKIAKNQVDTPLTVLTCTDLILVTRGFSLLHGEESNQCIGEIEVRMKNKLCEESLLKDT